MSVALSLRLTSRSVSVVGEAKRRRDAGIKPRSMEKVAVSYPYATEGSMRFHHSLLGVFVRDAATSQRIVKGGELIAVSSGANITNARNEAVAAFLALPSQPDWLWFIDTDMVFPTDILDRLVGAADPVERPIVGGLCFSWQQGRFARPTTYTLRTDGQVGVIWNYPPEQLFEVDATGTGCLLIHRSVLEAVGERYGEPYRWFRETEIADKPIGEDITFCIRARALGFPVFVDSRVKVGHEKTIVVDEDLYRAQQSAKVLEPTPEPTFVVIPTRVGVLVNDDSRTLVIPNDEGPLNLSAKWNHGLEWAEKEAAELGATEWNVAILNDDLETDAGFLEQLARGLRSHDDVWVSYPNVHGFDLPSGVVVPTRSDTLAGQTMSGYAFMVRGECGLRFDERFAWWYGDSDFERQVRFAGKQVVAVGGCHVNHLRPMESTRDDPELLVQAKRDEAAYAEKWGLDSASLWLALNPEFGS